MEYLWRSWIKRTFAFRDTNDENVFILIVILLIAEHSSIIFHFLIFTYPHDAYRF